IFNVFQIIDSITLPIIILKSDGQTLYANHLFRQEYLVSMTELCKNKYESNFKTPAFNDIQSSIKLFNREGNNHTKIELGHSETDISLEYMVMPIEMASNPMIYLLYKNQEDTETTGNPYPMDTNPLISNKKNKEIYEIISNATFESTLITENGIFLSQNKVCELTFGYADEEAKGMRTSSWVIPEDRQVVDNRIKNNLLKPYQATALRKDGTTFPCEIQAKSATIDNKTIRFAYIRDISEKMTAVKKLIQSERKFKNLFENSGDAITILENGRLVDCNSAFVKMLNYDNKKGILQKTPDEISPETQSDGTKSSTKALKFIEFAKKEGSCRFDWCHMKKTGEIIPVEVLLTSLYSNDYTNTLFAVVRDITQRKNREKELVEAIGKAKESDRLKSAFLANMSHEIRTPMNGILGFAQLLKDPQLEQEDIDEYIEAIDYSGKRMLNIINDLIDISKIEAQQMVKKTSVSNINELLEYLYHFFKQESKQKNIQIAFSSSLVHSEALVETDHEKLYAILVNLIKNAIKYTIKGHIDFGYIIKGNHIEFFVTDTGTGIPEELQKNIFERFIRIDANKPNTVEGAGLGLAITKAYVELLDGKIWVQSKVNKGSTFYFTIPFTKAQ
ncbi:MAG: PAS domain-containing sensor histidine kinase, partial [Bacteroidales bacterium]|nr:PAS domain-containing sensor histidine kinase [Bacteroidales bacterium]